MEATAATPSTGPPWWTEDMPELVARREAIRGVEKWQTTYVRYKAGHPETQPAPNGWELATSQRLLEQNAVTEQQRYMLKDHPLNSGLAPTSVNIRITEAPAEYCVPVKQDRRLTPDFKVRVDVKYRGRVQLPVQLKAYIITQHERDTLHSWAPEELYDPESPKVRKHVTELKGTTVVSHLFEAGTNGVQHYQSGAQRAAAARRGHPGVPSPQGHGGTLAYSTYATVQHGGARVAHGQYMDLQPSHAHALPPHAHHHHHHHHAPHHLAPMEPHHHMAAAQHQHHDPLTLRDPVTTKGRDPLLAPPRDHMYPPNDPYPPAPSHHAVYSAHHHQEGHALDGFSYVSLDPSAAAASSQPPPLPAAAYASNPPAAAGVVPADNWDHDYDNHLIHSLLHSTGGYSHSSLLHHLEGGYANPGAPGGPPLPSPHAGGPIRPEPVRYTPPADDGPPPPLPPEAALSHEFEFSNVEFLKPTRMSKVYMVFACTILDHDLLLAMYDVPTVGICRAEQRAKACAKLNIPYGDVGHIEHLYAPPAHVHAGSGGAPGDAAGPGGTKRRGSASAAEEPVQRPFDRATDAPMAAASADDDAGGARPRSRRALREWIQEEYDNTGLTRKLSQLDLQALESQAGFPQDLSADACSVSVGQWEEFKGQFQQVLQLLKCIASVWNLEDPCLISGFDMDRLGTVQALAHEPAGTFICRFSMSQPGCLVLTTKVPAGNPNADADGLIHAIIKIDDLNERRVDTWIRDFAGATHILDVYKQKRVDKRKVFASTYTRLRNLDLPDTFDLPPGPV